MKKEQILKFLKSQNIWFWLSTALFIALAAFLLHDCAYALAVVIPTASGRIISGSPLTTEITRGNSKELLMNEVDKRITKVRPMSTPIDQLSRYAGARKSGSMIVDYYSVDVKPTKATLHRTGVGQRHHRRTEGATHNQQQRHFRSVRDHSRARGERL